MRASLLVLGVAACSAPMSVPPAAVDGGVASFELLDVNPASATHGQRVGPGTLAGVVSGWYFTHST